MTPNPILRVLGPLMDAVCSLINLALPRDQRGEPLTKKADKRS